MTQGEREAAWGWIRTPRSISPLALATILAVLTSCAPDRPVVSFKARAAVGALDAPRDVEAFAQQHGFMVQMNDRLLDGSATIELARSDMRLVARRTGDSREWTIRAFRTGAFWRGSDKQAAEMAKRLTHRLSSAEPRPVRAGRFAG